MAELLARIVRLAQAAAALAIIAIVFAPVLMWIWPYVWPWLLLFALIASVGALEDIARRLEGARQLRDDW
jgi:UDP-N-acetylmuramyl pentapeptide phosphotransferase/UDP-N-acetylglucosamine-1-phosphate transferase